MGIRLRYYPAEDPNAAVKTPGGTGKAIHAMNEEGTKTLCGKDLDGYALAEADPLDPGHSDFCKKCRGKM